MSDNQPQSKIKKSGSVNDNQSVNTISSSKKKSTARLENYQVMQCIGEGAFGTVNLA